MESKDEQIVVKNFYGEGKHIYEKDLGWQEAEKQEAHSVISKEIFEYEILTVGFNIAFYYVDNDTFYGLHTEWEPIEFKILPRKKDKKYLCDQCEANTHLTEKVLYYFDDEESINNMWNLIKIDGKSLEEVLERSVILTLL